MNKQVYLLLNNEGVVFSSNDKAFLEECLMDIWEEIAYETWLYSIAGPAQFKPLYDIEDSYTVERAWMTANEEMLFYYKIQPLQNFIEV